MEVKPVIDSTGRENKEEKPMEETEPEKIEMTFARSIVIVSTMQSGNPGSSGLVVNAHINLTRKPDL